MIVKTLALGAAAVVLLGACATVPAGPSVMVLPGSGKSFDQFQVDDVLCRQWAGQQTGATPGHAMTQNAVTGAALGTLLGAAAGAAIGAASGSAATGAAVGAGVGLLGGTAVGAGTAEAAGGRVQERYDVAYVQCMYAKGHQVPVSGRFAPGYASPPVLPPAGTPPPPPPGAPR
ncbi:MAG: hypothetical protein HYR86_07740 [Candidatus Rokubacteria bacterium]|nr:hypothetical protein [Candidatus Rokubacteria bacterium]